MLFCLFSIQAQYTQRNSRAVFRTFQLSNSTLGDVASRAAFWASRGHTCRPCLPPDTFLRVFLIGFNIIRVPTSTSPLTRSSTPPHVSNPNVNFHAASDTNGPEGSGELGQQAVLQSSSYFHQLLEISGVLVAGTLESASPTVDAFTKADALTLVPFLRPCLMRKAKEYGHSAPAAGKCEILYSSTLFMPV